MKYPVSTQARTFLFFFFLYPLLIRQLDACTGLKDGGSITDKGRDFLVFIAFRPALLPIRSPIPRILGALYPVIKQPVHESHHSPPPSSEIKEFVELYVVIAWCFGTGATLPPAFL
jgi:hypothetical protein